MLWGLLNQFGRENGGFSVGPVKITEALHLVEAYDESLHTFETIFVIESIALPLLIEQSKRHRDEQ